MREFYRYHKMRQWLTDEAAERLNTALMNTVFRYFAPALALSLALSAPTWSAADDGTRPSNQSQKAQPEKAAADRSGRKKVGKASIYAKKLAGKTMADGTPMRIQGDNAASKTLPLGTTAEVTNLETGKSAVVTIRDRGPYVKGRIIDLSPGTAQKIGLDHEDGVAKVEVVPISVPAH